MTALPAPETTPLLILAGGRATRLGDLSDDRPKFLMPLSDGRAFADVQLAWAHAQGFRQVRLSVGYKAEQIEAYCGDGARWGLSLSYAHDGPVPLGTGGAVKRATADLPAHVAVLYGDTILALDCRAALQKADDARFDAVMSVLKDPPDGHACNATLEGDRVLYAKKNPHPAWRHIDYGFLVLSRRFLSAIPERTPLDLAEPLEQASREGRVAAFETHERFWEINTPESLEAFRRRFAHG